MLLSLDPATSKTGYCFFEANHYHSSGVFAPKGSIGDRIVAIGRWLENLDWSRITDVACEKPTGDHNNRHVDRVLGMVYGVCMYVAMTNGAKFHEVYPVHVIAQRVGKRNRAAGVAYIYNETGELKREIDGNEADALAVALAWLEQERVWT